MGNLDRQDAGGRGGDTDQYVGAKSGRSRPPFSFESDQTAKQRGEETGADLMLIGTLNSIVDQEGREAVVYYQVNMELVEIESNMKVWIGEKKIKKYISRATKKF